MRFKPQVIILAMFYLLYISVRLYFSIGSNYFSDNDSYYALRQIEHIRDTGKPLITDNLSYSGRIYAVLPFYFYLLALAIKVFPGIITIKIISNLLASLIIPSVYLLVHKVTSNRRSSIISAVVAAMIPLYITKTFNNISEYSFIIPLVVFILYLFLKLDNDSSSLFYLIPITIAIVLTSSSVIYLLVGIIIYFILNYLENKKIERIEMEYASFFMLFFLWVNFLMYKNAFQMHGFQMLWGNMPKTLLENYFLQLDVFHTITVLGILPILTGVYTIYNYIMRKYDKDVNLLVALFLTGFSILWLKLTALEEAYLFLSLFLVLLFGIFLKDIFLLLKKTIISEKSNAIFIVVVIIIVVLNILPSFTSIYNSDSPPDAYYDGFIWIKNNTPEDSVILGKPQEGNLISYFGDRKNVIDTEYMLIEDADTRYDEVVKFYKTRFKIDSLRIIDKYNINYFVVSNANTTIYQNDPCFIERYNNNLKIYEVNSECKIRE